MDSFDYTAHTADLVAKVQFLLDSYVDSDDGEFTFPDGDTWSCNKRQPVAPEKTFIVSWESDGNIEKGQLVIDALNIAEGQDKFWLWLRNRPVFQHMWNLKFEFVECERL